MVLEEIARKKIVAFIESKTLVGLVSMEQALKKQDFNANTYMNESGKSVRSAKIGSILTTLN